jgi:hypothetical protein
MYFIPYIIFCRALIFMLSDLYPVHDLNILRTFSSEEKMPAGAKSSAAKGHLSAIGIFSPSVFPYYKVIPKLVTDYL